MSTDAALLMLVKNWRQHRCPSTEEWIDQLAYLYNGTRLKIKKDQTTDRMAQMNLKISTLSELSQELQSTEVWSHLYETLKWAKITSSNKNQINGCFSVQGTDWEGKQRRGMIKTWGTLIWSCHTEWYTLVLRIWMYVSYRSIKIL